MRLRQGKRPGLGEPLEQMKNARRSPSLKSSGMTVLLRFTKSIHSRLSRSPISEAFNDINVKDYRNG